MRQLGDYVLFQSEGEQDLQFEIRDREKEENLPCDTTLAPYKTIIKKDILTCR